MLPPLALHYLTPLVAQRDAHLEEVRGGFAQLAREELEVVLVEATVQVSLHLLFVEGTELTHRAGEHHPEAQRPSPLTTKEQMNLLPCPAFNNYSRYYRNQQERNRSSCRYTFSCCSPLLTSEHHPQTATTLA